jgi:Domain of unknown function (DUF397)
MTNPDWAGANWRVSSYTSGNGDCVSLAKAAGASGVRDSKDPSGPVLAFSTQEMRAFFEEVKIGKHDQLTEGL